MHTTPTSIQRENASVSDSSPVSEPTFASAISPSAAASYATTSQTLSISDESAITKILVRSDQPQFGLAFGTSRNEGEALVCGTRPDEWLILGMPHAVEAAEATIDSGGFTNVIPFTHGRSLFRITGGGAPAMLEKVCGIDWSDNMTPNGAVVTASVALTTCDIIRNDLGGEISYLVMCDRSFGRYLFDALIDAGDEFGITVSI